MCLLKKKMPGVNNQPLFFPEGSVDTTISGPRKQRRGSGLTLAFHQWGEFQEFTIRVQHTMLCSQRLFLCPAEAVLLLTVVNEPRRSDRKAPSASFPASVLLQRPGPLKPRRPRRTKETQHTFYSTHLEYQWSLVGLNLCVVSP